MKSMGNLNGLPRATQVPMAEREVLKIKILPLKLKLFQDGKAFYEFFIKIKKILNCEYRICFNRQQKVSLKT